jgi:hypothetical protein
METRDCRGLSIAELTGSLEPTLFQHILAAIDRNEPAAVAKLMAFE